MSIKTRIDSIDDFGDLEELESFEDLDNHVTPIEDIIEPFEHPDIILKSTNIFKKLTTLYKDSSVPFLITDHRFFVHFGNLELENSIIRQKKYLGQSFFNILDSTYNRINTSKIIDILRSPDSGYSWVGRVYIHHTHFLNVTANVIFTPIYEDDSELNSVPIGYICMFDDITRETKEILSRTYLSLLEASKLKDNDTGNHIRRVGEYSRIISKQIFINKLHSEVDVQFIENIAFLAPMHDVGKIGTPDTVLNKSGPLDENEWRIMREHTINGGFIMGGYPDPMAKQIPISHHERWDGSGYPYQLSEEMIPLSARIVTIADVYDALRMKRAYKKAFSHEKACEILRSESGSHFDPSLISLFLKINKKIRDVFDSLSDT